MGDRNGWIQMGGEVGRNGEEQREGNHNGDMLYQKDVFSIKGKAAST